MGWNPNDPTAAEGPTPVYRPGAMPAEPVPGRHGPADPGGLGGRSFVPGMPSAPAAAAPPMPGPGAPMYSPGGLRARLAIGMLAMMAVLDGVGALIEVPLSQPFYADARGEVVSQEAMVTSGLALVGYGLVYLAVYVITIVAYCMWIHRAYRNLSALGAQGLRQTPGWAVGWHFVPFMNLVRPCQAMSELWRASDPRTAHDPLAWHGAKTTALVGLWWATWLGTNMLSQISVRMEFAGGGESMYASTAASVFSSLVGVIAAVVLIQLIRGIGRMQDRRYQMLQTPPGVRSPGLMAA